MWLQTSILRSPQFSQVLDAQPLPVRERLGDVIFGGQVKTPQPNAITASSYFFVNPFVSLFLLPLTEQYSST
jgi:hypothetical protein